MNYSVSLQKCNSYNQDEVDKSIRNLFGNIGGIKKFVKKNSKVLLKPNVVSGMKPEECGTTHPAVIESLIKILKEIGCDVYVGDHPFMEEPAKAMKICGISDACTKQGAKIAIFDKKIRYPSRNSIVVKEFIPSDISIYTSQA